MRRRLPPYVRRCQGRYRAVVTIDGQRVYGPLCDDADAAHGWAVRMRATKLPERVLTFVDGLERLQVELAATGASAGTRDYYRNHGRIVAREIGEATPLHAISADMVREFARAREAAGISPATVWRNEVTIIARVLRLAAKRGWIPRHPMDDVQAPKTRQRPFDALPMSRVRELVDLIRRYPVPTAERDADIVALFALTGLRRAEVARLRRQDVQLELERIWVRGKNQDSYVIVTPELRPVLERMLLRLGEGDALVGSWRMLEGLFYRWGRRLAEPKLTPHVLRHSYGTELARRGVGIDRIRRLMRHSSLQMTMRYLHATDAELREAACSVSLLPRARSPRGARAGQRPPRGDAATLRRPPA